MMDAHAYNYNISYTSDIHNKKLLNALDHLLQELNDREKQKDIEKNHLEFQKKIDEDSFSSLVKSYGYYDVETTAKYNSSTDILDLYIKSGSQYKFEGSMYNIQYETLKKEPVNLPNLNSLNTQGNDAALALNVADDEKLLSEFIENNNCFFNYSVEHDAYIDRSSKTILIVFNIKVDENTRFNSSSFSGNESVDNEFLRKVSDIQEGECFKRSTILNSVSDLEKTNLFANINTNSERMQNGDVDVNFNVRESKHKTIKSGVNYSTDTQYSFMVGWEHRNIFSAGEKLDLSAEYGHKEKGLKADFQKPYFIQKNQTLHLDFETFRKINDAYQEESLSSSAGITRKFSNDITAGLAVKYGYYDITEQSKSNHFALLSTPLFTQLDLRNNPLNATKGHLIRGEIEPFTDTLDQDTKFLKLAAKTSFFKSIIDSSTQLVLATRVQGGIISGLSTASIPATERYYLGGANSIRGYKYKTLGPIDNNNDPLGGRSYFATNIELRLQYKDYGAIPFFDFGNVKDKILPDDVAIRKSVGLGLAYFTIVGPLRLDVALPLDKRKKIDHPFEAYFRIGQVF